MGKARKNSLMRIAMMESISKANHMAKASIFGPTEIVMREDSSKGRAQVTEY